jgi:phosphatidylglycerophosphate synthase
MVLCPNSEETALYRDGTAARLHERRTASEFLADLVFRPLAGVVVRALLPLRVPPGTLELANGLVGLAAAGALAGGELLAAALLLQLKTVLDNADGRLARESGRASALGRYLDTEIDLVVNAALFAALAYQTGSYVLAPIAFVALTLILSVDFNEDVLRRRAHGETVVTEPSADGEGAVARALAAVYRAVFGVQDRALQAFARRRLEGVLPADPERRERGALAYHDLVTATILANLGLSTQLAVLGILLVAGVPIAYLWIVLGCAALLPLVQLRREVAARRAASG